MIKTGHHSFLCEILKFMGLPSHEPIMYGFMAAANFLPILFYWWLFFVPGPALFGARLHSDNLRQRNKLELTVSWLTVLSRPARQLGIRIVFHKRGLQKHWTNSYNSHSSFAIHCFSESTSFNCLFIVFWLRPELKKCKSSSVCWELV